jgi:hypothetical protein
LAEDLASSLRSGILDFLAPLAVVDVQDGPGALFRTVGHVGEVAGDPGLTAEIGRVASLGQALAAIPDADLTSWDGLLRLLTLSRELMAALQLIEATLDDPALATRVRDLGVQLTERLAGLYLRTHHPRVFRMASVLTLAVPGDRTDPQPILAEDGRLERLPWQRDALELHRLPALLDDPAGVLGGHYLPHGMAAAADAHEAAHRLFPHLADLAATLGLTYRHDLQRVLPEPPEPPPDEDPGGGGEPWPFDEDPELPPDPHPIDLNDLHRSYRPRFAVAVPPLATDDDDAASRFGLAVVASSAQHPGAVRGYVVQLFAETGFSEDRGGWRFTLSATGAVPAFVLGPGGVKVLPGQPPAPAAATTVAVEKIAAPGAPAFVVGGADGTRLQVGALRVGAQLHLGAGRQAVAVTVDAKTAAVVLAGDDGLLRAFLPDDGVRVPFELGLSLSSDRGLELTGGVGLARTLATGLVLGPIRVDELTVGIETSGGAATLRATGAIGLSIGPLTVAVDGVGVALTASFPPVGGSLGALDLDATVTPPTGAGLAVDAVLTGGGFLSFDSGTGRYAGVVQLSFEQIGITGFGLIETRLPGGAEGYALLVALRASFPAIQVGFGFALTSVGGIIALNRRLDVDALRKRLAAGTAGRILAPQDPVRNASSLLADVGTVFPVAPDVHVIGPTAHLVWAGLVHFDIGVFFELPGPSRVILLGSARATIAQPAGGREYLDIRVDVVGVIDLRASTAAFDAVLIDSQLMQVLDLTGGAAFRLSWGDQPYSVLTVGGFHPAYNPEPLTFPSSLTRVAMVHGKPDDRLYLRFEGYFAITTNTMQFGAAVEAVVNVGSWNIQGLLRFDALLRFEPFRFQIDIRASVRVRYKSRTLAGLTLTGSLTGPGPVVLKAKVCIELLFFDICFSDTFTIGSSDPSSITPVPSALHVLLEELEAPANLRPTEVTDRFVLLRPPPEPLTTSVVSPLGRLVWLQRQAPLDLLLQRISGVPLRTPQTVRASSPDGTTAERDWFAPGSFADLTDGEALIRRAFERLAGGLRLGVDGTLDGLGQTVAVTVRQIRLPAGATRVFGAAAFPEWLTMAGFERLGGRSRPPAVPALKVHDEVWTVSDASGPVAMGLSQAQAQQLAKLDPTRARVATPAADRILDMTF